MAALRFYTTAAFRTINNGLRDQGRYKAKRPHPFPVTVKVIQDALLKLRAVASESEQANTELTLYRGMKDMKVLDSFLQDGKAKGGTELAPMSTTSSLKVAMQYSASESSLLLASGLITSWFAAPTSPSYPCSPLSRSFSSRR